MSRRVGDPRLDGVDRARLSRRQAAAVLAAGRGVERRDEGDGEQLGEWDTDRNGALDPRELGEGLQKLPPR